MTISSSGGDAIGLAVFYLQNWDSNHSTFAPSIYTFFWPFTLLDQEYSIFFGIPVSSNPSHIPYAIPL